MAKRGEAGHVYEPWRLESLSPDWPNPKMAAIFIKRVNIKMSITWLFRPADALDSYATPYLVIDPLSECHTHLLFC